MYKNSTIIQFAFKKERCSDNGNQIRAVAAGPDMLQCSLRLLEQGGLQKQVAAGIAGNAQLRQDQQLDTASSGFFHAA